MKKINKRTLALLLAVIMTLGLLPTAFAAGDFGTATYDVINRDNYYTGAAVDNTSGAIAAGDQFKLTLTWNESDFEPGQTYTYTTPAGFVLYTSEYSSTSHSNGTLQDSTGTPNGSFSFSYNGSSKTSTITITFFDNFADKAAGKLELYGKFDNPADADTDNDGDIMVPGDKEYPIYKEPGSGQTHRVEVSKYGERKKDAELTFHYYIEVSAPDGDLTDVVVTDTPHADMSILTETVVMSNSAYSSNGVSLETTVGSVGYGSTTYSWTIPEIKSGKSVYIHYDAKLNQISDASFRNDVVATAGDKSDSDQWVVSLNTPTVSKSGTIDGNKVTWTIEVEFNDFDKVTLRENNGDTATIMNQSQNAGAQYTITYKPSGRQETAAFSDTLVLERQNDETSVVVTFDMILPGNWSDTHTDVDNTVYIYYTGGNDQDSATVPVNTVPRINGKTGKDLASNYRDSDDPYTKITGGKPEIEWTVDLSFTDTPYNLYNGNPKFGDVIRNTYSEIEKEVILDVQFVKDSFELYHEGEKVDWNTYIEKLDIISMDTTNPDHDFFEDFQTSIGWSYTTYANGMRAFILEFTDDAPAGNYTLKYKTSYVPENLSYYSSYTINNVFFASNNEYAEGKAEILLQYIRKDVTGLYQYGNDNVTDPNVTWFISFEPMGYNSNALYFLDADPITVTDTLPEGFIVKSVKLKSTNSVGDTDFKKWNPDVYSEDYYDTTYPPNLYYYVDGQQLVMTIGKEFTIAGGEGQLTNAYLEIETEYTGYENLVPGEKSKEFTNKAYITVNGTNYSEVSASVTITPPPLISKTISYMRENAPRPQFSVEVNPNGEDLMKGSDTITIRDVIIPDESNKTNQTFLADTLKVYQGIGASKTLVDANQYTVTVNSEKTEFTITGLKDATAYTIEYRTYVDVLYDSTSQFSLINQVYLDGVCRDMNKDGKVEANEYVYAEVEWHGLVQIPSAINNLSTTLPTVFVEKTDSVTGVLLKDAEFTIYDENNTVVGTITSRDNDSLSNGYQLQVLNHTYTMRETKAPEGYDFDENAVWRFGRYTNGNCPSNVENLNGKQLKIYEITNTPKQTGPETTSLTIKKDGGIDGETFIMNVNELDESNKVVNTIQIAIPANKEITIDGLKVDVTYTVTENENWAWRYAGTVTPESIILAADAANNTVTVSNRKDQSLWLSGDSYCQNWWNATHNAITQKFAEVAGY